MQKISISDQTLTATQHVLEIKGKESLGWDESEEMSSYIIYVQPQKNENMAHLISPPPALERHC